MDCQNMVFSQKQSQKRIGKALRVIPTQVLKKVLFFALYLLGARLNAVASLVEMPEESGKTIISRVMKDGMPAFRDRRQFAKEKGEEKGGTCELSILMIAVAELSVRSAIKRAKIGTGQGIV